jgi:radical SAM superfamily enzyme YgiQ (UPF0313 family)
MRAKVLVINEPFVKDFCRTQRWAARTRGRVLRAPDWLAYATAVLEAAGHDARLYDFPAMDWGKEQLHELVQKEQPDWVVLDATTPSIFSDIDCARIVKDVSKARVIMVGPHASALPEETLHNARGAVDVVAIGEYDYTVRDIVEHGGDFASVAGIAFYENGVVTQTPARPLIENLDDLPFPAWHHLDLMRYFDGGKLFPYIDVISGRGCPNRCVFCLWPQVMHGYKYRFRSAKNVVDELERDIKLCPQVKRGEFFFEDDTFTVHKARAIEICEEIMRRKLKITFSVNARVDTADAELFKVMKRAGCRELLVGFESGDQGILDRAHKGITVEKSRAFVAMAKQAKLDVHGCFVIGLPGETESTAEKTVNFAHSLGLHTLQFSGAVPFPGTELFAMAKKEGWLKTEDWAQWLGDGEQKPVVEYPTIANDRITHWVDKGLKDFYFNPAFMLRFLLETKSASDLYRKCRGAWNFATYLAGRGR